MPRQGPQWERIALPFTENLKRLGVDATIRTLVDTAQFQKRSDEFDFDMIVENWGHQRKHKKHYHFGLWLENGKVHSDEFDPQIYNDGVIHEPPPPKRRKAAG